jgi:ribonuclease VapC
VIVWDSGALIALINAEPGAGEARRLLRANRDGSYIHAVNLLEIRYGFERVKGTAFAERVLDALERAGVEARGDFDRAFLKDAALLKTAHKMSLADCFALALARRLGCPLASTDHHELDDAAAAGLCDIAFIR